MRIFGSRNVVLFMFLASIYGILLWAVCRVLLAIDERVLLRHINRNIDQDRSSTEADADYSTQELENHEATLNDAWRFINAARHQNFIQNEGVQRNHRHIPRNMHDQTQLGYENIEQNCKPNIKNTTWNSTKNKKYNKEFCFSTINDYLETLDNSSDEESPNIRKEKFFNIEHTSEEAIEIYDGTIYAVGNEGPMLIYSYKNKYNTSETNEVLINSPTQESQSNSTGSISVENLNEESVRYERSFFSYSSPFHPVMIPRLPLTTYMLPTVTEILEPSRQSPRVIELSDEDKGSVKRKPSNSWVMNEDDSSHSDAGNTTETNVETSADESPSGVEEQSLHSLNNTNSNEHDNFSKTDINVKTQSSEKTVVVDFNSPATLNPTSTIDSTEIAYEKEIFKQRNNYLDDRVMIQMNSGSKDIEKNSIKSKQSFTSPVESLSKHSSIPTLHLSLNTEIDPHEQSWFRRFIKCILCCK